MKQPSCLPEKKRNNQTQIYDKKENILFSNLLLTGLGIFPCEASP
jgi:hypothetical protein